MTYNNTTKTTTTTETTTSETIATTATTTPVTKEKCRVFGSMQTGVDTSSIKFKSVLEMRREFGENWM